jgi:transcriptional regulator with XRE-family HTH domain
MAREAKDDSSPISREIDKQVGQAVRAWRQEAGQTQQQLAEQLGLSYQQVQKYEAGSNRISAGRLYEIAKHYDQEIDDVYRDLPAKLVARIMPIEERSNVEDLELLHNFEVITDPQLRACLGGLVRTLSGRKRRKRS